MAILSNSNLLLSHVKNCFLFGDDTGTCELLIEKEYPQNYDVQLVLNNEFCFPIVDTTSIDFYNHSPEISYRNELKYRKSSAEVRVKEVERERMKYPENHTIFDTGQWPRTLDDIEVDEVFNFSEISKPTFNVRSKLAWLLETTDYVEVASLNPFIQYAKFSAVRYTKPVGKSSTKKQIKLNEVAINFDDRNGILKDFNIYFWDYDEQKDRSNPVIIRPIEETKVYEFIGLACWKYTEENRNPKFSDVNIIQKFQMFMFEDMDDLDMDFGFLHRDDPIYKYQFTNLAILECLPNGRRKFSSISVLSDDKSFVAQSNIERMNLKNIPRCDSDPNTLSLDQMDFNSNSVLVQIHLAHGISKFMFSLESTVEQIIQHTVNRRHLLEHGDKYKYHLELLSEPGKVLDLKRSLNEIMGREFLLIRDQSRRKPAIPDSFDESSSEKLHNLMDFFQTKSYDVYYKQTLKKWEARLTISADVIVIEPSTAKVSFIKKPKLVKIHVLLLADCIVDYHGQNQFDKNCKVTIKFLHLKKKSTYSRSFKPSVDSDDSIHDSDTSSFKSITLTDQNSHNFQTVSSNLLLELTSHSIIAPKDVSMQIYEQAKSIMDFKCCQLRREYLNLTK